mgnify:CR=1 FL=1
MCAAIVTQNTARAGKVNNVAHCEKIRIIFELGDKGQLMFEHLFYLFSGSIGVTPCQTCIGQAAQALADRPARTERTTREGKRREENREREQRERQRKTEKRIAKGKRWRRCERRIA